MTWAERMRTNAGDTGCESTVYQQLAHLTCSGSRALEKAADFAAGVRSGTFADVEGRLHRRARATVARVASSLAPRRAERRTRQDPDGTRCFVAVCCGFAVRMVGRLRVRRRVHTGETTAAGAACSQYGVFQSRQATARKQPCIGTEENHRLQQAKR